MPQFPATRHSIVAAMRSDGTEARRAAFDALVGAYWKPVFKYVRLKWHASPEDAADLTQAFFLRAFEKDFFAGFDPARARFRTYLRTCLDGFVSNARKADARLKRGGGVTVISIDVEEAERELRHRAANAVEDFDAYFHREWLRGLFDAAASRTPASLRAVRAVRSRRRERRSADIRRARAALQAVGDRRDQRARRGATRVPPPGARIAARAVRERRGVSGRVARAHGMISEPALDRLSTMFRVPDVTGTRYELLSELGRGGMGVVYLARDTVLDREVALKIVDCVPDADGTHGRAPRALATEARILARLEHPGIVPVHDFGELPDGRLFYAMKRVRGDRLDRWLAAGRDLAERLAVFVRVCEAVAFAHAHHVVHCDLKPENVMVGEFGEVLVLDWGIAQTPDCGPRTADCGPIAGTPHYMAPEQARGDAGADHRVDVHALGVMLEVMGGA